MKLVQIFAILFFVSPALAADISGTVTKIRDGDTIVVNRQPIGLNGVHAPELDELGFGRQRVFHSTQILRIQNSQAAIKTHKYF